MSHSEHFLSSLYGNEPWFLCLLYRQSGHTYRYCPNNGKIPCLACELRDHFRGECDGVIRDGNPRFDLQATSVAEAKVKQRAWHSRCETMLNLSKPYGYEEMVLEFKMHFTVLPYAQDAWKVYCAIAFQETKQRRLEAGVYAPVIQRLRCSS
jgi:hypothetical protein